MKLKISLCTFFKNVFDRRSPIDKIIDLTGKEYVAVWNGVSRKRQYLLDEKGDKHNKDTQLIGLGFGRWIDNETGDSAPIVAIYIGTDGNVVHSCVSLPYQLGSDKMKIHNECFELNKLIKPGQKLESKYNNIFDAWIKNLFKAPSAVRYHHRIFLEDILNPDLKDESETIWQDLVDSTEEYLKKKK